MAVRKRARHHVNPLGFIRKVDLPDLRQVFAHPERPMEVDVGCDKGDFLFGRAEQAPEVNVVGLEIREPVVDMVKDRIARRGLDNATVVYCNANASFAELFPPASLRAVYVHFPDPWFKVRHQKRRLVTPAFVDLVASRLEPGGLFEFMTDFEQYAAQIVPLLEAHPAFQNPYGPGAPAPAAEGRVLTHREEWHTSRGDAVHRYHWRRRSS
jgi:tRNA (guanine-N7-)-methyltransferase